MSDVDELSQRRMTFEADLSGVSFNNLLNGAVINVDADLL